MAEPFKPGMTVRLNSGGPLMTVDKVTNDRRGHMVWCVWFDEKNQQKNGTFAPDALRADDGTPRFA